MRIRRVTGIPILLLTAVFFLSACGGGGGGGGAGPSPPTVTTASNDPSLDTAVISGNVNPNGLAATAWFEYGEDSSLSNPTRTDNQAMGSGKAPASINATLAGLNPGTTYYYRVAASNSAGTAKGTIASFATLSTPPTVITTTSGPDADNAVISGSVNPNGLATHAWFEYAQDPDSSLSNPTRTDNQATGSGKAPVSIGATLTPLNTTTKYWWRAAASNAAGTSHGEIKSFTTTPNPPPIASAGLPQSVFMGDSVTLDGSGSSDGNHGGSITSYQWTQPGGTQVTLSNATSANPTFTAPSVVPYPGEVLTFQVTVTSSRGTTASDDVDITVKWGLSDEFSTDTTGDYTFGIDNGTGTFTYDPSGQRALVTTGNDDVIHFSQVFSESNSGVFSLDFSPIVTYSTHGGIWVRLYQNPLSDNTYYEVSNFDWSFFGFEPTGADLAAFKKIVGGVEVEKTTFKTSYLQGTTHHIKITFGPAITTMEAFGQKVDLSGTGNPVGKFEIKIGQQDAYIDNILLEPKP
jgi:hypothetical protein